MTNQKFSSRPRPVGRPAMQNHKGSDPPSASRFEQASLPKGDDLKSSRNSAWRQAYLLARKPWVFVPMVGTYWTASVTHLLAEISAINVASVFVSTFVLALAVAHNLVDVVERLGTIFRQIGIGFRAVGRTFSFIGGLLKQIGRKLRIDLNEI